MNRPKVNVEILEILINDKKLSDSKFKNLQFKYQNLIDKVWEEEHNIGEVLYDLNSNFEIKRNSFPPVVFNHKNKVYVAGNTSEHTEQLKELVFQSYTAFDGFWRKS